MMMILWQRHTVGNGHWVCYDKTIEEIILCRRLGTGYGLASSTVLCLPPDSSSRENRSLPENAALEDLVQKKKRPKNIMGNTSGQNQEKKSKSKPYQRSPKQ